MLRRPSTGTLKETRETHRAEWAQLDEELELFSSSGGALGEFAAQFKSGGQRRSVDYEQMLRHLLAERGTKQFGRGFAVYPALRPDLIVGDSGVAEAGEYRPCALTSAGSDDEIADAIRRTGHCVEFTSFLRENLEGLEEYLRDKIERYAIMLESV